METNDIKNFVSQIFKTSKDKQDLKSKENYNKKSRVEYNGIKYIVSTINLDEDFEETTPKYSYETMIFFEDSRIASDIVRRYVLEKEADIGHIATKEMIKRGNFISTKDGYIEFFKEEIE